MWIEEKTEKLERLKEIIDEFDFLLTCNLKEAFGIEDCGKKLPWTVL